MSKVTLTSILKLGLIFFGITILYTSCEREDDHSMVSEKMDNLNKDFNFNQKSFNELKNNSKFIKAFKKCY